MGDGRVSPFPMGGDSIVYRYTDVLRLIMQAIQVVRAMLSVLYTTLFRSTVPYD